MRKANREPALDMEYNVNEFRNHCSTFFASKEGREACTSRHSWLIEVEKLRGDVFAQCVRQATSKCQAQDVRVLIECDDTLIPVVCAKVVETAKARIPYLFRRQGWSPFKKHEKVLVLLATSDIMLLDSAMTLPELGDIYGAGGMKAFDESLPWVGVGMPLKYEESNPSNFSLNLGYRIETVGFDVGASRIVVRAKDCKYELAFGI